MRSIAGCRGALTSLGTDGFGRSEGRAVAARLLRGRRQLIVAGDAERAGAGRQGRRGMVQKAIKDLGINPEKPNPAIS